MNECPNCGMLPFACVCVPWCYKHGCIDDPCKACQDEFGLEMIEREKHRLERRDRWRAVWREVCEFFG